MMQSTAKMSRIFKIQITSSCDASHPACSDKTNSANTARHIIMTKKDTPLHKVLGSRIMIPAKIQNDIKNIISANCHITTSLYGKSAFRHKLYCFQRITIIHGNLLFYLLKFRNITLNNPPYQFLRSISIINMSHIISFSEHFQPKLPIKKGIYGIGFFDNAPGETSCRCGAPLISQQFFQKLPSQFKLNTEFVDDSADDKLIVQHLFVGTFQYTKI